MLKKRERIVYSPGWGYICIRLTTMQQSGNHIPVTIPTTGNFFTVGLMTLLLVFLTAINFFLYPPEAGKNSGIVNQENSSQDNSIPGYPFPAGPDEKSPDAPVNINEEYVHESHGMVHQLPIKLLILHKIHEAEKLCVVHFERLSPPPEA